MLSRISTFLCGGLLFGLLAPLASAQTSGLVPESFKCDLGRTDAIPRLVKDLKSPDEKVRDQAIVTLGSFGKIAKPAAPALVEVAVNSRGHALALQALAKIDDDATRTALRKLLVGGTGRCKCGNSFLFVVASAGEPIVPHLISLTAEKDFTSNAASAIVQIGEPALPHVIRSLESPNETTRTAMVHSLFQIGAKAKSATPALEKRLAVENGMLKLSVAQTLHLVNGTHKEAFDVLHNAVRGNDKTLRHQALHCLYSVRSNSKELIPTLMNVVATDEPNYVSEACAILTNIGVDAVPTLIEELNRTDSKHRVAMMSTLSHIGPGASASLPTFIAILDGKDRDLSTKAAYMLPNLGPDAKRAIPHLLAALKIDDATLRLTVAASLARIDPQQVPKTIPPVVEVLRTGNANEKLSALWLLNGFGAQAKPAIPAMVELLKTEPLPFRFNVANVLINIDSTQLDTAMPTLIEMIQRKKDQTGMQRHAVQALARLGPKGKSALPALTVMFRESLKGEHDYVDPQIIVHCMKKIDPAINIMPTLIEALNSDKREDREEARYLVQGTIGFRALTDLDAAVANGQLRETPDVIALMKQLRKQSGSANK